MTTFPAKFLLVGLVCLALAAGQDLNYHQLRRLYNSRVRYAQRFERPMGSFGEGLTARIRHAGVVVETADGGRWLIHKGKGYGRESQTVVTRASHMSNSWHAVSGRERIHHSTVSDYVAAGRASYNLFFDNCLHSSSRMMNLN